MELNHVFDEISQEMLQDNRMSGIDKKEFSVTGRLNKRWMIRVNRTQNMNIMKLSSKIYTKTTESLTSKVLKLREDVYRIGVNAEGYYMNFRVQDDYQGDIREAYAKFTTIMEKITVLIDEEFEEFTLKPSEIQLDKLEPVAKEGVEATQERNSVFTHEIHEMEEYVVKQEESLQSRTLEVENIMSQFLEQEKAAVEKILEKYAEKATSETEDGLNLSDAVVMDEVVSQQDIEVYTSFVQNEMKSLEEKELVLAATRESLEKEEALLAEQKKTLTAYKKGIREKWNEFNQLKKKRTTDEANHQRLKENIEKAEAFIAEKMVVVEELRQQEKELQETVKELLDKQAEYAIKEEMLEAKEEITKKRLVYLSEELKKSLENEKSLLYKLKLLQSNPVIPNIEDTEEYKTIYSKYCDLSESYNQLVSDAREALEIRDEYVKIKNTYNGMEEQCTLTAREKSELDKQLKGVRDELQRTEESRIAVVAELETYKAKADFAMITNKIVEELEENGYEPERYSADEPYNISCAFEDFNLIVYCDKSFFYLEKLTKKAMKNGKEIESLNRNKITDTYLMFRDRVCCKCVYENFMRELNEQLGNLRILK